MTGLGFDLWPTGRQSWLLVLKVLAELVLWACTHARTSINDEKLVDKTINVATLQGSGTARVCSRLVFECRCCSLSQVDLIDMADLFGLSDRAREDKRIGKRRREVQTTPEFPPPPESVNAAASRLLFEVGPGPRPAGRSLASLSTGLLLRGSNTRAPTDFCCDCQIHINIAATSLLHTVHCNAHAS